MPNHRIDFKGGSLEWDNFSKIDWISKVDETHLSEDILLLKYHNCLIDMGWYGDFFSIMVVLPDDDGRYSAEGWGYPFARIPCDSQYDMLVQLQRAIDMYPTQADAYAKKWRTDKE